MTPKDYLSVLQDLARKKEKERPYAMTEPQKAAIIILFEEFADLADVKSEFAIMRTDPASWFRHRVTELIFGKSSLNEITIGGASLLLDEFGKNIGGCWQLTDSGKQNLYQLMDIVAENNPRQVRLL